ncbi:MAG: hypothetical protein QOJ39_3308 [Candidatus Eremiobacteraeota bacterium]|nr:hypothetical protein [Candidatus Eremiobacteraeota bacterium]
MTVALAAVLAPLPAPAAATPPPAAPAARAGSDAQPNEACNRALEYEKTSANDTVSRQASYDSAVAGLTANVRCNDAQMKLVNEAYLLSMRAAAEHELKIGNWQRDMERANMLLAQCTNWPGLRGKAAGNNCATQRQYNMITTKTANTVPSPRPASPSAIPTPPAPGAPARTAVPLPPPVAPNPSPTPRR